MQRVNVWIGILYPCSVWDMDYLPDLLVFCLLAHIVLFSSPGNIFALHHIDRLMQERCNSSAFAMGLRLSGINPSISFTRRYAHWTIVWRSRKQTKAVCFTLFSWVDHLNQTRWSCENRLRCVQQLFNQGLLWYETAFLTSIKAAVIKVMHILLIVYCKTLRRYHGNIPGGTWIATLIQL